jgi:hypothetical protein
MARSTAGTATSGQAVMMIRIMLELSGMRIKNRALYCIACIILLISVNACGWGTPVSDATNQCVPPQYPDLLIIPMRGGEIITITTTASITEVNAAYMDELSAVELSPNEPLNPIRKARWHMIKFPSGYAYGCDELVSPYIIEGGCIYLQPNELGTSITLLWEYSEGLSGCESALQISTTSGN